MKTKFKARDKMGAPAIAKLNADIAKLAARELTGEGFLKAPARISRTGIQEYTKLELGIDASMDIVRLYRSPEEVFAPETLASGEGQTITYYHPEKGVDSSNWKTHAVGDFHNVAKDAEAKDEDAEQFTTADLIVRDGEAVRSVAYGVKELSLGYSFDAVWTPGTTPSGQSYDGLQTNIRINHLAIVYSGRCGSGCAVGDCGCSSQTKPKPTEDTTMKIKIGKFEVTVADDNAAAIIQGAFAELGDKVTAADTAATAATKRATDAEAALAAQGEEMKRQAADHKVKVEGLDATIKTLTAATAPEAISALAIDYAATVADAKIVDAEFATAGLTVPQIRAGVLTAAMGKDEKTKARVTKILSGQDVAKASEPLVKAAFDAVVSIATDSVETVDAATQRAQIDALVGKDGKAKGAADAADELGGRALMVAVERGQVARQ